jgi:hypothetical protein
VRALFTKWPQRLDARAHARDNGRVNGKWPITIALVTAAIVFAFSAAAPPVGGLTPPADVFPLFALLTLLESVAFGVGVAFVVSQRATLFGSATAPLRRAVYFAIAYLFLAPWPHDWLHRITYVNGAFDWLPLAGIEYVFHLGIVPIGIAVAVYAMRRERTAV